MEVTNIAIIGGGATAVAFLKSFVDIILVHKVDRIKITLFEISSEIGTGVAYQKDLPNLLINRPVQTMSAYPHELDNFQLWLQDNKEHLSHVIVEGQASHDNRSYISREIFGLYLKDLLEKTRFTAKLNNISIEIVNEYVDDISGKTPFTIKVNKRTYLANYVILCTGNNNPSDIYQLNRTENYINNPYPLFNKAIKVDPCMRVGIIGNSLTAIDIALSLRSLGHQEKITMLSRSHLAPRVRGKISTYQLRHLTKENILKIRMNKGNFSLRDALRLFRKELKLFGFNWKSLFLEAPKEKGFIELMKKEIEDAGKDRQWQAILSATNQIIEICWHNLNIESKTLFMNRFHRIWLNNRSPIPITNANKLLEMLKNNQLDVYHSIKEIEYNKSNKKYTAAIGQDMRIEFDYIINATGPSKYVEPNNLLLYTLLEKGFARENIFGGLEVDFQSSAIIDRNNPTNPYVRLLGHNTVGVYYYTSSLEMIVKRSTSVAQDLIKFIIENTAYDKNQMAYPSAAYSVSSIASSIY